MARSAAASCASGRRERSGSDREAPDRPAPANHMARPLPAKAPGIKRWVRTGRARPGHGLHPLRGGLRPATTGTATAPGAPRRHASRRPHPGSGTASWNILVARRNRSAVGESCVPKFERDLARHREAVAREGVHGEWRAGRAPVPACSGRRRFGVRRLQTCRGRSTHRTDRSRNQPEYAASCSSNVRISTVRFFP